jgi:hypothetical protein
MEKFEKKGAVWCSEACRKANNKAHSKDCKPAAAEVGKPASKTIRVGLAITTVSSGGLSEAAMTALAKDEVAMQERDAVIETCLLSRNQVEGYVLNFVSELEHSLQAFVTEEELEPTGTAFEAFSMWLEDMEYDERPWAELQSEYTAKLAEAKLLGDVILDRQRADGARADAINALESFIADARPKLSQVLTGAASSSTSSTSTSAAAAGVHTPKCKVCAKTAEDVGKAKTHTYTNTRTHAHIHVDTHTHM